jgi:ADP-heptose:LPS heptosyltransferase
VAKRILLRNTQPLLGDRLMFTPLVRDLKRAHPDWQIGVLSAGPEVWLNNPHMDPAVNEANAERICDVGPGKVTRGSKTNGLHCMAAFRCSLEEQLGETIVQGPFKPDVYLSPFEKAYRMIDGDYWVVNCDTGPFSAKRWPLERFQAVVDAMPDLTFVQVGLSQDCRGHLKGHNVIDLIDKTKVRELFGLVYHAQGCISLISSLMHVAAAFDKPCAVIAGGREPPTFERYAWHRYIDNVGCLPCCRLQACWHNALSACKDHDGEYARCMRLIEPVAVVAAVRSYYAGGLLSHPKTQNLAAAATLRPLLRIVARGSFLGGAERSWTTIARLFVKNNWRVEICPPEPLNPAVAAQLPPEAVVTNHLSRPCDVLLLYASDLVFGFDDPKYNIFDGIRAARKVMALTYKIGKAGQAPWTKGWDKYLFLSSTLRDQFQAKFPNGVFESEVLAPCVDLEPFLAVEPDYAQSSLVPRPSSLVHLVRHSSQGDKKYPADLGLILERTQARYSFMPSPPFLDASQHQPDGSDPAYTTCAWSDDPKAVGAFLAAGNCFWYLLPDGYTDQGPRVIVEAMAAGLPVIAENRDGARDRVGPETGWLLDSHEQAIEIINSLTPELLAEKGRAARKRAVEEFNPQKWFETIHG